MIEHPFGWWSVVPPVLAIGMALLTRQVILSLLGGVWVGRIIQATGNPLAGSRDTLSCLVDVLGDPSQARVLLFTLLVGSVLILMQRSGGVEGFVRWTTRWSWTSSRRGAQLMAWLVGLGIFIESNITCLVVGTVSRPLFDRLRISREKLAYICDSTSAPVCMLLPINGWGALILGLLATESAAGHLGGRSPLWVFLAAVPLNFYALSAVLIVLATIVTGRDIGPMRRAETRARQEGKVLRDGAMPVVDADVIAVPPKRGVEARLRYMLIPLVVMGVMVLIGIIVTGLEGTESAPTSEGGAGLMRILDHASGSTAVLWAITAALVALFVMIATTRLMSVEETLRTSLKGAAGLMPLAVIMLLAFAIGATCRQLGTGAFVASVARPWLSPAVIAPVVFVVSSLIAFATGTSWGTFTIMIPLAVPLAANFQADGASVNIPLVVAAVLSGGVFGDHCSPISDTTVVSSMAACSDHIDHVRTQLPYALIGAGIAFTGFWLVGL